MKKITIVIVICVLLFALVGCDIGTETILGVQCNDENVKIIVDDAPLEQYKFEITGMNRLPQSSYPHIGLTEDDYIFGSPNKFRFEIVSSVSDTYNLTMKLNDDNSALLDWLRVAIAVDGELKEVYRDNSISDNIYQKQNDPDFIKSFESKKIIFSQFTLDMIADSAREIMVFIWLEEGELYDSFGTRYTGRAASMFGASHIDLSLEISEA